MATIGIGMPLEQRLNAAETTDVVDNVVDGVGMGLNQLLGPVTYAGAAAFLAYVGGNLIGDEIPRGINYLSGLALQHNVIPALELNIAIPRGYGLVEGVANILGRDPNTISSGAIASAGVAAAYLGYVGSRLIGPVADRFAGKGK